MLLSDLRRGPTDQSNEIANFLAARDKTNHHLTIFRRLWNKIRLQVLNQASRLSPTYAAALRRLRTLRG